MTRKFKKLVKFDQHVCNCMGDCETYLLAAATPRQDDDEEKKRNTFQVFFF